MKVLSLERRKCEMIDVAEKHGAGGTELIRRAISIL